jgi:hypothetical protein
MISLLVFPSGDICTRKYMAVTMWGHYTFDDQIFDAAKFGILTPLSLPIS